MYENPKKKKVEIHENFRLIGTCIYDNINKMSPAFINRFDIIYLEDQLLEMNESQIKEFIDYLLKNINIEDLKIRTESTLNEMKINSKDENDSNIVNNELNENSVKRKYEEIKDLTFNIFNQRLKENSKEISLVLELSQLCKSIKLYDSIFQNTITSQELVDCTYNLLINISNYNINKKICDDILEKYFILYKEEKLRFFFKKSQKLINFMVKIYLSSLINLPLIIEGSTGTGKTSSAIAFSKIRRIIFKEEPYYKLFSFNIDTKPTDLYGTYSIQKEYLDGSLTYSLKKGLTFIADEMNLSNQKTLKSLAPILEPNFEKFIYIPNINEKVEIDNKFFFIVCQNEIGSEGRNKLPYTIQKRLKTLKYPNPDDEDILKICKDIKDNIYIKEDSNDDDEKLGNFYLEYNKINNENLPKLSFRDIKKIFKRIEYQNQEQYKDNFRNIKLYHNILFYILSSIDKNNLNEIIDIIISIILKIFKEEINEPDKLKDLYKNYPKIDIKNKNIIIEKGECEIIINDDIFSIKNELKNEEKIELKNEEKIELKNEEKNELKNEEKKIEKIKNQLNELYFLPNLCNAIFTISLAYKEEPILISGNSGYKTYLAKKIMSKNTEVISLNQESTINQLLGNPKILNNIKEEKSFLFDIICLICQFQDKYKYLEKFKWDKEDIIPEIIKENIKNEIKKKEPLFIQTFKDTIEILQNKLFEKNNKSNSPLNIYIEYRPGFIFSSLLQGKQIILKDITNLPTEVLERFNELLSTEPQLQLNEDLYNTFTNENKKKFENFLNFRIIATCPLGCENKLSEAVLSRFTVVTINDYTEKEIEYILNKKQILDKKDIKYIVQFIKNINKEFNKEISILKVITI